MKILGVIPARGGSKGVPRKNIKLLNGKSLLAYTSEIALKSKLLDKVILSTEDEEILSVGKDLGLEIPFRRPEKLSLDNSKSIDVVLHALNFFKEKGIHYDAICLLQPTNPFRSLGFLNKSIEKFINSKCDTLFSALEVPHEFNPHWTFKKNDKDYLEISTGEKEIISRRQDLPKSYYRDGSIYITKTEIIFDRKSFYGSAISYIDASNEINVNIDTLEDWEKAESVARKLNL